MAYVFVVWSWLVSITPWALTTKDRSCHNKQPNISRMYATYQHTTTYTYISIQGPVHFHSHSSFYHSHLSFYQHTTTYTFIASTHIYLFISIHRPIHSHSHFRPYAHTKTHWHTPTCCASPSASPSSSPFVRQESSAISGVEEGCADMPTMALTAADPPTNSGQLRASLRDNANIICMDTLEIAHSDSSRATHKQTQGSSGPTSGVALEKKLCTSTTANAESPSPRRGADCCELWATVVCKEVQARLKAHSKRASACFHRL